MLFQKQIIQDGSGMINGAENVKEGLERRTQNTAALGNFGIRGENCPHMCLDR